MHRGFSLIWVVIVVAIVALSVYVYFVFNNSAQQTYRQNDLKLQSAASAVYQAATRYRLAATRPYSDAPLSGVALTSEDGQSVLKVLTDSGELRPSVASSPDLGRVYISSSSLDHFNVCFAPRSFVFKTYRETRYDSSGNPALNCNQQACYFCFVSNRNFVASASPTPIPDNFIASQDPCADYNPDRPLYPFISDSSSKWLSYGCLSYIVQDQGCSVHSVCGANRRHLVKKYTGSGVGRFTCLLHQSQTTETHCVDEPYAKCLDHPDPSQTTDFTWGCDSPRRPVGWQ